MKRAFLLLAFSSLAAAQAPAPEPSVPKAPEQRPPLKLNLEQEPVRGAPRITFGPRDGTPDQRPASMLPELGGRGAEALDRRPSEVVPKDENPGR